MFLNKRVKLTAIFTILIASVMITSCTKEAGEGGLASISGKVYAVDYNKAGYYLTEGYAGDVRVYMSVDGSSETLDDIRTQYDGSFSFPLLRKGNYKIWVYSRCDSCLNEQTPIVQDVTISGRKEKVVLPDFKIDM